MERRRGEIKEVQVFNRRFGDEQSTLMDRFERHSFEVHLNRAMLGRSLSDPTDSLARFYLPPLPLPPPQISVVKQGRPLGGLRLQKFLKKLLKPIICRGNKGSSATKQIPESKRFTSWKTFSRSLRL